MEVKMKFVLSIFLVTHIWAFQAPDKIPMSPIVAYWKTLTQEEKGIYLFSYLTQVYDTYGELKMETGYGELTTWYYDNRAELVFGIFDQLEKTELTEFVGWVDEFYRQEDFVDRPFYEALAFAFRFQKAAGKSIWEKFENMKFDKIKPK